MFIFDIKFLRQIHILHWLSEEIVFEKAKFAEDLF